MTGTAPRPCFSDRGTLNSAKLRLGDHRGPATPHSYQELFCNLQTRRHPCGPPRLTAEEAPSWPGAHPPAADTPRFRTLTRTGPPECNPHRGAVVLARLPRSSLAAASATAAPATPAPPDCADCHDSEKIMKQVAASVHDGMACLDCHPQWAPFPHPDNAPDPRKGAICATCHSDEASAYTFHGAAKVGTNPDIPTCVDCHGGHGVLAPDNPDSSTNPSNLPKTCGRCHSDIDIVRRYHLDQKAVAVYRSSVHGRPPRKGTGRRLHRLPRHWRRRPPHPGACQPGVPNRPDQHPRNLRPLPSEGEISLPRGHPRSARVARRG